MVVRIACIRQGFCMKMKWWVLQIAREQKTRALEVLGLSKTKEVQNLEDFGSKMLSKSSAVHLYSDLRLTNACQIAKGTAMYL